MTPLFRLPSPCALWSVKRQHVSSLVLRATSRRHLSQVITPSLCVGAFAFHPFIPYPRVLHYTHIKRPGQGGPDAALISHTAIECHHFDRPHTHVAAVSSASSLLLCNNAVGCYNQAQSQTHFTLGRLECISWWLQPTLRPLSLKRARRLWITATSSQHVRWNANTWARGAGRGLTSCLVMVALGGGSRCQSLGQRGLET